MKLRLPHKNYDLNLSDDIEDKMSIVNSILQEKIYFHENEMTVEEYFSTTWDKENTKVALDIIGYYLTKENKDLTILSNTRRKEMENGSDRHTTFSGMGIENQLAIGLIDEDDYAY